MKAITIISNLVLFLSFAQAQDFSLPIFNASYTACSQNLYDLERLPISEKGWVDKYLKDDNPYTGCATSEHRTHDGVLIEYRVFDILDGYPTSSKYYLPDGSVSREFNFQKGKRHGLHVMYHKNGLKYIEEHYENGKEHGIIKRWTEQGVLAREAFYQHGIPIYDKVYIKDDNC